MLLNISVESHNDDKETHIGFYVKWSLFKNTFVSVIYLFSSNSKKAGRRPP